ncbi:MAG: nitrate reductase molybdenum cofactor assembly chaperone [Proteobacteria bacterium]|nr:nitrate reductase molybdenum cofactor assembly chaperone [Pseudomonadota bacterium]
MARTLRVLARLLAYPDHGVRAHLAEMRDVLHAEAAISQDALAGLDALIAHVSAQDPLDAEADYVQLFDSGRRTALYLFEHVHGDSRERGPALIDLAQTFEQAGLYLAAGEMPDHLPVVLEFASTQPPSAARAFLAEIAHLLAIVHDALRKRQTPYAAALLALIELSGETPGRTEPPADESLDATWAEPAAFAGCGNTGQAGPGAPRPIPLVRRPRDGAGPGARR